MVLDDVYTVASERGRGHAHRMLGLAQVEADSHCWPILCRPSPHHSKMTLAQLVDWYRNRGFHRHPILPDNWLIWENGPLEWVN